MTESGGEFSSSIVSQPRFSARLLFPTAGVGDRASVDTAAPRAFSEHPTAVRHAARAITAPACGEARPALRPCGMASIPPAIFPGWLCRNCISVRFGLGGVGDPDGSTTRARDDLH